MPERTRFSHALSLPLLLTGLLAVAYFQMEQEQEQAPEEPDSHACPPTEASEGSSPSLCSSITSSEELEENVEQAGEVDGGSMAAPLAFLSSWFPLLPTAATATTAADEKPPRRTADGGLHASTFLDGFTDLLMPHRGHAATAEVGSEEEDEEIPIDPEADSGTRVRQRSHIALPVPTGAAAASAPSAPPVESSNDANTDRDDNDAESDEWERIDVVDSPIHSLEEAEEGSYGVGVISVASTRSTRTETAAVVESSASVAAPVTGGGQSRTLTGGCGICCVCHEAPSCVLFRPCNHLCTCAHCAARIDAGAALDDSVVDEYHRQRQRSEDDNGEASRGPYASAWPGLARVGGTSSPVPTTEQTSVFDSAFDSVFALVSRVFDAVSSTVAEGAAPSSFLPRPRPRCPICNTVYVEQMRVFVT